MLNEPASISLHYHTQTHSKHSLLTLFSGRRLLTSATKTKNIKQHSSPKTPPSVPLDNTSSLLPVGKMGPAQLYNCRQINCTTVVHVTGLYTTACVPPSVYIHTYYPWLTDDNTCVINTQHFMHQLEIRFNISSGAEFLYPVGIN